MAKLTKDSTVAEALENEKAVALVEEMMPGITKNPAIRMVKRFPLKKLVGIKQVHITEEQLDEMLAKVNEDE